MCLIAEAKIFTCSLYHMLAMENDASMYQKRMLLYGVDVDSFSHF